jgi:peptidoglycan-associated lipoprotein
MEQHMRRVLFAVCAELLVAGCASRSGTTQQQKTVAEQKDQQSADEAAKRARVQQVQAQLNQQLEEQKRRPETEQPMVKPLADTGMTAKSLSDPAPQLKDPSSPLSKRSIYYDFDAYNIKVKFQTLVEAQGKFLLEHRDLKVRVEGNCDERGSRAYNLALGQRRVDSLKRAITLLGVPGKQITTVSYGSEKPKAPGHEEEAWAENRWSDIVYIGIDEQR